MEWVCSDWSSSCKITLVGQGWDVTSDMRSEDSAVERWTNSERSTLRSCGVYIPGVVTSSIKQISCFIITATSWCLLLPTSSSMYRFTLMNEQLPLYSTPVHPLWYCIHDRALVFVLFAKEVLSWILFFLN